MGDSADENLMLTRQFDCTNYDTRGVDGSSTEGSRRKSSTMRLSYSNSEWLVGKLFSFEVMHDQWDSCAVYALEWVGARGGSGDWWWDGGVTTRLTSSSCKNLLGSNLSTLSHCLIRCRLSCWRATMVVSHESIVNCLWTPAYVKVECWLTLLFWLVILWRGW